MSSIVGGRYRLDRLLGQGGMGAVYEALDVELNRTVALKFLSKAISQDQDFRSRFIREAKTLAKVRHERLVTLYHSDEEDGQLYIVQEYLQGQTLAELLVDEGPLAENEALKLYLQAAEGLACLHEAGLVHRDIKPDNIFIDETKGLKLLDFGLVLDLELTRLTPDNVALGTRLYLSPELIKSPSVTSASDVFQMGLVFHEMLTGRLLDRSQDCEWHDLLIISDERRNTPPPAKSISEPLRKIIADCCHKKAIKRIQNGQQLLARLTSVQRKEKVAITAHTKTIEEDEELEQESVSPRRPLPWQPMLAFCILLIVVWQMIFRPSLKVKQNKTPYFRIVQMVTFPDGVYLKIEKKQTRHLTVEFSGGGDFQQQIEISKEQKIALCEFMGNPKSDTSSITLRADDGTQFRHVIPLPQSTFVVPLRVRANHSQMIMKWQMHGLAKVTVETRRPGGSYRLEGLFRQGCTIALDKGGKQKGRKKLQYRLSLGRRVLCQGEVTAGFRQVYNLPKEYAQERIVAELFMVDRQDRLHLLTRQGKWMALRPIETKNGLELKQEWCYDAALAISKFRSGVTPSAGCERAYFHQLKEETGLFTFEKQGCVITSKDFAIRGFASFPHRQHIAKLKQGRLIAASTDKSRRQLLTQVVSTNPLSHQRKLHTLPCEQLFANIASGNEFYLCGKAKGRVFLAAYTVGAHKECVLRWQHHFELTRRVSPFRYEDYPLSLSFLRSKDGSCGLCLLLPPKAYLVENLLDPKVREIPFPLSNDCLLSLKAHADEDRTTLIYADWQNKGSIRLFKRVGLLSLVKENDRWQFKKSAQEVKVTAFTDLQRVIPIVKTASGDFVGGVDATIIHFDGQSLKAKAVHKHPSDIFEGLCLWDGVVLCFGPSSSIHAVDL